MWMTWWPFAYGYVMPRASYEGPMGAAKVLSAARHPSATPERLRALVGGLPWRVLRETWESSTEALGAAQTDAERLALARLRDVLLWEMETNHPRAFARWYGARMLARQ